MKTVTVTLYSVDELAPDVRAKVIEKYRDFSTEGFDWWRPTETVFIEKLEKLGYSNIKIAFTGFYSQGDGASFTATLDICQWLKTHKLITKYRKAYNYAEEYGVTSIIEIIRTSSRYSHENTCDAELSGCDPSLYDANKYDNKAND